VGWIGASCWTAAYLYREAPGSQLKEGAVALKAIAQALLDAILEKLGKRQLIEVFVFVLAVLMTLLLLKDGSDELKALVVIACLILGLWYVSFAYRRKARVPSFGFLVTTTGTWLFFFYTFVTVEYNPHRVSRTTVYGIVSQAPTEPLAGAAVEGRRGASCESGSPEESDTTDVTGWYRLGFTKMGGRFRGCVRLVITPPPGIGLSAETVDVHFGGDSGYQQIDVVLGVRSRGHR